METLFELVKPFLPGLAAALIAAFLIAIGLVSFLFDVRTAWNFVTRRFKAKRELRKSIEYLKTVDYFIAHVIQVGGEFSMLYSMFVYSNEEGGYYFNPASEFVWTYFTRGGDLLAVSPAEIPQKAGFEIESVTTKHGTYNIHPDRDICHLGIHDLKNEYLITFKRKNI